jgi:uncharacterized Zn finger protein
MIFPVLCPHCSSDSGRRVIPESPEVDSFRCERCGHAWSQPAAPVRGPIPAAVLPRHEDASDGLLRRIAAALKAWRR